jgi:hypothetical protein
MQVRQTVLYRLSIWGMRIWFAVPLVACIDHKLGWPIIAMFVAGGIAIVPFALVQVFTVAVPSYFIFRRALSDTFNPRFH